MKHLDLFSGIGGFAVAAHWMKWQTVQFVEIDKFCQRVLHKNFPGIPLHGDIKTFDAKKYRGTVDIVTGGFPCQPFSHAGQRQGTKDDRYLWPEMFRVIREVQPPYVVGENVYGLLNWSKGLVFDAVQTSLENEGYALATVILPACGLNAPHRRERVWFVAYSERYGIGRRQHDEPRQSKIFFEGQENQRQRVRSEFTGNGNERIITDAARDRVQRRRPNRKQVARAQIKTAILGRNYPSDQWNNWPTVAGLCRNDVRVPNRIHRLKALGNSIVPHVAYQLFKAIEETTK